MFSRVLGESTMKEVRVALIAVKSRSDILRTEEKPGGRYDVRWVESFCALLREVRFRDRFARLPRFASQPGRGVRGESIRVERRTAEESEASGARGEGSIGGGHRIH